MKHTIAIFAKYMRFTIGMVLENTGYPAIGFWMRVFGVFPAGKLLGFGFWN